MNLKRYIQASLITLLLLLAEPSFAERFQLKGLSLGVSSITACGDSEVTSKLDDIIKTYKSQVPSLIEMGATECEVKTSSFGGNDVTEPTHLLFQDGALILLKLEINQIPVTNVLPIYESFVRDYGKPKRVTSRPFVTYTWKKDGETLILENLGRQWDDNDLTIILRNEKAYKSYQGRADKNSALLKKLNADKARDDIR